MSLLPKAVISAIAVLSLAVAGGLASCSGAVVRPDGGKGLLPVGAIAPDVVGQDQGNHAVRLSSLRGHTAVVYFYPKDGTPGCTKEACAFRDAWDRYAKADVTIFGVSRDSADRHRDFAASHKLPFPLVPDEDGTLARAYGVGSFLGMTSRVSFLVGADGRIVKVWPDVDPAVHADEVLVAASSAR
jgi:peroxiredoxin Q/BCP